MYSVYLGDNIVGKAQMLRKGLYYEIICRCSFEEVGHSRIYLAWDASQLDLGICAPFEGGFGFRTMVPAKTVGEGQLHFYATKQSTDRIFVAVYPDKPFSQLHRLRSARFALKNGQPGLIFQAIDPQGNGQNP